MKNTKGKIAGIAALASGLFLLSGCGGNTSRTTVPKTTPMETTTDVTTTSEAEKYEITFVTNYEESIDPIRAEAGETITLPMLERTGYLFKGWFKDKTFTTPYTTTKMPSKNITLYAKWDANEHKIEFDMAGADPIDTIYLRYGDKIVLPSVPEREGYTFMGWEEDVPQTMPDQSLTLTAVWQKNTYTITFIYDDGEENVTVSYLYGDTITYPEPVKKGYAFAGWNKGQTAFEMPAENLTYTAYWDAVSYSITYFLDGGEMKGEATSYTIKDEVTLPVAAKEGYAFLGWYLDESYTESISRIEEGTTGNLNLYALFRPVTYSITYMPDGGTLTDAQASYTINDEFTLTSPVKEGYTFTGWYLDEACETPVTEIEKGTTGNITLYAAYTINSYTISFDTAGGTEMDSMTLEYGADVTIATTPEKEGCTFKGWSPEVPKTMPAGDITLTAVWERNTYTITFDTAGGSAMDSISVVYGDAIPSIDAPTRTKYEFLGWDQEIPDVMPSCDITLTALWKQLYYAVNYVLNDEEQNTLQEEYESASGLMLYTPSYAGHDFAGWYDNEDLTGTAVTEIPAGTTGDLTYYAKWSLHDYTITYDLNGGTLSDTAKHSFTMAESYTYETPSRPGYAFEGWYSDSEFQNPVTGISEGTKADVHIYAKWEILYTLNSDKNEITGLTTKALSYASLEIPSSIDGVTITSIDFENASHDFTDCGSLTEVILPDTLENLGYHVFADLSLEEVAIPASVATIREGAFYCSSIKKVTFEANSVLTSVGYEAFAYCESLTAFTLPDGVKTIGDEAFLRVTKLTSFTFPSALTSIGDRAFMYCTAFTSVSLKNTKVTSIGENAFSGCAAMTAFTFPDKANAATVSLGSGALAASGITTLFIRDGISVSSYLLERCLSLTSLTIDVGVINAITQGSVSFLGNLFRYTDDSSKLVSGETACYRNDDDTTFYCIPTSLTSVTITNETDATMADYKYVPFFAGMDTITTVNLYDVHNISICMFYNCRNLTDVYMYECTKTDGEDTMFTFGVQCFSGCASLARITYNDNLTAWCTYTDYPGDNEWGASDKNADVGDFCVITTTSTISDIAHR